MLWSPFQPPERYRSHYVFLLACILTSSFYSTRASRPSVLSLKKTGFRHSSFYVYSWSSVRRPPMSTRPLCVQCVYPISSCLKAPKASMSVRLRLWTTKMRQIEQKNGKSGKIIGQIEQIICCSLACSAMCAFGGMLIEEAKTM